MARNVCVRCGEAVFVMPRDADNVPHLCADIRKRLARRERQVAAVEAILREGHGSIRPMRDTAEAIVTRLAGMGVADMD